MRCLLGLCKRDRCCCVYVCVVCAMRALRELCSCDNDFGREWVYTRGSNGWPCARRFELVRLSNGELWE